MEQTRKGPGILTGLLVGILITIPLIALFFLLDTVVGLPLVPLDVFDWMGRNLPGGLLTFGIETMVSIIRGLNLGPTDEVAKFVELWFIGTGTFFIVCVITSAVLFAIMNRVSQNRTTLVGLVGGAILGVVFALLSQSVNFSATTPDAVNFVFIVVIFAVWGLAVAWAYGELARRPTSREVAATPVPAGRTAPATVASAQQIDRRQFLVRLGGATATLTVAGVGVNLLLGAGDGDEVGGNSIAAAPTPTTSADNATAEASPTEDADATAEADATADATEAVAAGDGVEPAPGTRPEYTSVEDHYRIDIASRPPSIDGQSWAVEIGGMVANPVTLTLESLRNNYESQDMIITMQCISNPIAGDLISTTRWTGVPLQDILEELQVEEGGGFMKITAADGFDEIVDLRLAEDRNVMICYAWDDQPLTELHGFPIRIYIPNRYGMKQPKWITGMEVIPEWEPGYWVRRGWSQEAIMRTVSVVDTVATNDTYEEGGTTYVPIGGIAFAGARGISKVEVSIDNGDWVEAELRDPLSDRSWVLWRYDWPFAEGIHTFSVRAVDGEGNPQIEEVNPVHPDGATGIHMVSRTLSA
jgi:DMSO/TMAO reductase YedYZ molybdopterin-dependent catalytic subunit